MYLKHSFRIFLVLLTLASPFSACSQTGTKSSITQTINGKKYYIHKVDKGESLYGIAKLYNTDVNSIVVENPDAIDGIKKGQELKIPTTPIASNNQNNNINSSKNKLHTVAKGETVYSITKKYNITESELLLWNPEVKNGLKEGQVIKVGVNPNEINQTQPTSDTYIIEKGETVYAITKKFNMNLDEFYALNPETKSGVTAGQLVKIKKNGNSTSVVTNTITETNNNSEPLVLDTVVRAKKNEYNLGLFLPFELNETDLINTDQLVKDKKNFPEMQTIAIDFYEGIKYALDSLQGKGCTYKLNLFDTRDKDSIQIDKILKSESLNGLDLVIGPMFNSTFKVVSEQAMKKSIPIVSPVTQQNKILFNNPFSSKVTPSNATLIEALAEFVVDSCKGQNVVLINSGKPKELNILKIFKVHYNDYLFTKYNNTTDTISEVKGVGGAKGAYRESKKNYYIVLSEDEVFLTDILTQLNTFTAKKKELNIIGLKRWVNIDYLDPEYLNKFNFTYPCPYYINYKNNDISKASDKYRAKYFVDPSDFYFQGIDIGLYYLEQLKNQGPDFYKKLDQNKKEGLIMDFNFFRPNDKTGFDNKSLQMIRYSSFTFQKIN